MRLMRRVTSIDNDEDFEVDAHTRQTVTIERAGAEDASVVANLMELYCHDLSTLFNLEVGPDGRFGYARLPLYFSEPRTRHAYLIRHGATLAGFALVRAESPLADLAADFDVAEFFILRAHRRHGVGRDAAAALWDRHPGTWVVRVADGNLPAVAFWRGTIDDYAAGAFTEQRRTIDGRGWHVFVFPSRTSQEQE